MTKIKTTKKGMAKKTLSMSLVLAMLATSNVPVWAADFSDGTDTAVAAEAEAPVVDATEEFSDDAADIAVQAAEAEAPAVEDFSAEAATATRLNLQLSVEDESVETTVKKESLTSVKATIDTSTLSSSDTWYGNPENIASVASFARIVWTINDSRNNYSMSYYNGDNVAEGIPNQGQNVNIGDTVTVTAYIVTKSANSNGEWNTAVSSPIESKSFKVIGNTVADYIEGQPTIEESTKSLKLNETDTVNITLPTIKTELADNATIETKLLVDGEEEGTVASDATTISVEAGHTYQLKSHIVAEDGALEDDIESNVLTVTASEVSSSEAEVTWNEIGTGTVDKNTNELSYTYKKGDSYVPTISKIKIGDNTYTTDDFSFSYENNTEAGNANVVVTFVDGDKKGQVLRVPFTINQADLSKATVALGSTYVYAPVALQEESLKNANLTVTLDGVTLKAAKEGSTDAAKADVVYTLVADEAGQNKGTITIKPKDGNYKLTTTLKFDIAQKDLSTAYVINPEDANYTGNYITPNMDGNADGTAAGVYYKKSSETAGAGVSALTSADFDIDWNGTNFNKGTATATITGKGNYTGTTTATFKINSASVSDFENVLKPLITTGLTENNGVYEFTYTGKEQDFIRQAYGLNWTLGSQYTYSYQGQHTNVGDFTVKIVGQNSYEGNSFTLKCRIVPQSVAGFTQKSVANPNGQITVADLEYAGNDAKYVPSASIVWNGMTLKEGIDFEISGTPVVSLANKNVTFTIKGLGNYTGTKANLTATILGKNINSSSITVAPIENQTYTGSAISMKGKLVVKDGNKTLVEGTDYHIVTEKNNTKPGVATVTIAGHGNYSGEKDM